QSCRFPKGPYNVGTERWPLRLVCCLRVISRLGAILKAGTTSVCRASGSDGSRRSGDFSGGRSGCGSSERAPARSCLHESHWLVRRRGPATAVGPHLRPRRSAAAGERRLLAQRGATRHCNSTPGGDTASRGGAAGTTGRRAAVACWFGSKGSVFAGSRATSGPRGSDRRGKATWTCTLRRLRQTSATSRRNQVPRGRTVIAASGFDIVALTKLLWHSCGLPAAQCLASL
ncbi:unnamed protein product, partial [Ixodes pacificus]